MRALGDTGNNKEFLHYQLTSQQARYFSFFVRVKFGLRPDFSLTLFVLLNQKRGEKLDYLQNEVSCLGFTPEIFAPLTEHVTAIHLLGAYASFRSVT